jgi:SAM-dependent methyltransferase
VSGELLHERIARLERERVQADERYNDALTALDRALGGPLAVPDPPSPPATATLETLSRQWNTAPAAPPAADRSLKGRLRTFIWRMIGPPLEAQKVFNASLVEHATQAALAQTAIRDVVAQLTTTLRAQSDARVRFEAHLIQYLQTVTWYVDTKDRMVGSDAQVINAGLSALADDWLKRWESLQTREQRWLQHVQHLVASVDDVRATSILAQQTSLSIKRDMETLVAGDSRPDAPPSADDAAGGTSPTVPDLNAFKYLAFENAFRGSPEDIRQRLTEYLPRFAGRTDVLEIGCGRGEFLALLRDQGVRARGLDSNDAMVRETRDRGLDAVQADALEYLTVLPDASLGGLFAAQVVEHLPPRYLGRLIEVAMHKLRPGGIIVLETINPTCWVAFFESYIRDLTHTTPLHPETLQFMLRAAGFQKVTIEYKAPVPEAQQLARLPWRYSFEDPGVRDAFTAIVDRMNAHAEALNARLFGFQDYAIIGEK